MRDHSLICIVGSKLLTVLSAVAIASLLLPGEAAAGGPEIVSVNTEKLMPRVFRFDVTVLHEDESPEHYVDRWEILDEQGVIIDVRQLGRAHVNEQPFTRSLSHVTIPLGTRTVTVRAHDTVHGYTEGGPIVHLNIETRDNPID